MAWFVASEASLDEPCSGRSVEITTVWPPPPPLAELPEPPDEPHAASARLPAMARAPIL